MLKWKLLLNVSIWSNITFQISKATVGCFIRSQQSWTLKRSWTWRRINKDSKTVLSENVFLDVTAVQRVLWWWHHCPGHHPDSPEDLVLGGDLCVLTLLTAQRRALKGKEDKCQHDTQMLNVLSMCGRYRSPPYTEFTHRDTTPD